jgi:hypothetical protein
MLQKKASFVTRCSKVLLLSLLLLPALLTNTGGYTDPGACMVPAGYGYTGGGAHTCLKGFYNDAVTQPIENCKRCPLPGLTTRGSRRGATSLTNCSWVLPGWGFNTTRIPFICPRGEDCCVVAVRVMHNLCVYEKRTVADSSTVLDTCAAAMRWPLRPASRTTSQLALVLLTYAAAAAPLLLLLLLLLLQLLLLLPRLSVPQALTAQRSAGYLLASQATAHPAQITGSCSWKEQQTQACAPVSVTLLLLSSSCSV